MLMPWIACNAALCLGSLAFLRSLTNVLDSRNDILDFRNLSLLVYFFVSATANASCSGPSSRSNKRASSFSDASESTRLACDVLSPSSEACSELESLALSLTAYVFLPNFLPFRGRLVVPESLSMISRSCHVLKSARSTVASESPLDPSCSIGLESP